MSQAKDMEKPLSAAMEDYLEAVLVLVRAGRVARVSDIAKRLGVGKSSVTAALKALAERKLVHHDPYQTVTLTDRGRELAEEVSRRHHVLRRFFADVLGLPGELADANACRVEHTLDRDVLERLRLLAEFIERCPRAGRDWIESFLHYCSGGPETDRCEKCLRELLSTRLSEESA
ncbi:MAG: metal-dependent transcriptional regulator [Phycisphaerae bacterium]